jgi:hypothetical protein
MNFNIQKAAMFEFFVFDKDGLIKSCSSFDDLSLYNRSHLQWHDLSTEFHKKNLSIGSKVIGGGGGTDRQTDW